MAYFITGEIPLPGSNPFSTAATYQPGERINLLLLGTDARPGEKDARTDSIIVASIEPYSKKAALISVPRDSLVSLPGHGEDKINSANVIGGPELTKQTVEGLLDIKIDHYIKTNFDGFRDIIDTLGGVTIDVEKNMRYRDPTDGTNIDLKKGVQLLTGKTALDYSRYRHDALGDISRTQRQQKMLKAVAKELLQPKTMLKLPELIPQINKAVETDLDLSGMLKLAGLAKNMENMQIVSQTLPGQFYNNHGSYWKVDEVQARMVLNNMLNGVESDPIAGPDITVGKTDRTAKADIKVKPSQAQTTNPKETTEKPADPQAPSQPEPTTDPGQNSGQTEPDGTTTPVPGDGTTPVTPVPEQPNSGTPSGTDGGSNANPGTGSGNQPGAQTPGAGTPSGPDNGIGPGNAPTTNVEVVPQT